MRPTYLGMNVDEYARDYVKRAVQRGRTVQQVIYGQHGRYSRPLRLQVGGGSAWDLDWTEELTKVRSDQLFVMIEDEWKVFDLHKLFEEAKSGATQASLL